MNNLALRQRVAPLTTQFGKSRVHDAIVKMLADPAVRVQLMDLGVDIVGNSPSEFDAYDQKMDAVVKISGPKVD